MYFEYLNVYFYINFSMPFMLARFCILLISSSFSTSCLIPNVAKTTFISFLIPLVIRINFIPFLNTMTIEERSLKKVEIPPTNLLINMTSCLGKLKALVFHKLQNCSYCRIAKLCGNLPFPCCCPVKKCMINLICSCAHVIIELFVVSVSSLEELASLFIFMCTRGQICIEVYVVLCVQTANF